MKGTQSQARTTYNINQRQPTEETSLNTHLRKTYNLKNLLKGQKFKRSKIQSTNKKKYKKCISKVRQNTCHYFYLAKSEISMQRRGVFYENPRAHTKSLKTHLAAAATAPAQLTLPYKAC